MKTYPYYEPGPMGHYKKIMKGPKGAEKVKLIKGKMPIQPKTKKMVQGIGGLPDLF